MVKMKNKILQKITLLLASMITMMAGAVVAPSIPQINKVFEEIPNSELLSRLILTLPAIFIALSSPLFGYLADKYGRKKFLLFSALLYSISGTSGFYLNDLYLILAGRAFLGIAVGGIMTIVITLVGDYFNGKERGAFMGQQGAFMGIGGIVFIIIAGILADVQWHLPFLIYGFAVPVFLLIYFYIYEPNIGRNPGKTIAGQVKGKAEYPKLRIFFIYSIIFIGIIIFYMLPVQIPFALKGLENMNSTKIQHMTQILYIKSK